MFLLSWVLRPAFSETRQGKCFIWDALSETRSALEIDTSSSQHPKFLYLSLSKGACRREPVEGRPALSETRQGKCFIWDALSETRSALEIDTSSSQHPKFRSLSLSKGACRRASLSKGACRRASISKGYKKEKSDQPPKRSIRQVTLKRSDFLNTFLAVSDF